MGPNLINLVVLVLAALGEWQLPSVASRHGDVEASQRARPPIEVVISAAFSPDGRFLLTGRSTGKNLLTLWDVTRGRELHMLSGHEGAVLFLRFLPSNQQALSVSEDRTLRLWDVRSGRLLRMVGRQDHVIDLADLSANGNVAFSTGYDRGTFVNFWDVTRGTKLVTPLSDRSTVCDYAALSPDGQTVVAGEEGRLIVRSISSGRETCQLQGSRGVTEGIAFSPDGRVVVGTMHVLLANRSVNVLLALWDAATGRELRTFGDVRHGILADAFTADGKRLLVADRWGTVTSWEVESGKKLIEFSLVPNMKYPLTAVAFSRDGKLAFVATGMNFKLEQSLVLELWDIEQRKLLTTFAAPPGGKRIPAPGR